MGGVLGGHYSMGGVVGDTVVSPRGHFSGWCPRGTLFNGWHSSVTLLSVVELVVVGVMQVCNLRNALCIHGHYHTV